MWEGLDSEAMTEIIEWNFRAEEYPACHGYCSFFHPGLCEKAPQEEQKQNSDSFEGKEKSFKLQTRLTLRNQLYLLKIFAPLQTKLLLCTLKIDKALYLVKNPNPYELRETKLKTSLSLKTTS